MKKLAILFCIVFLLSGCTFFNKKSTEEINRKPEIINDKKEIPISESVPENTLNNDPTKMPTIKDETSTSLPSVILKTSMGDITLELFEKDSPVTVANFLKLAQNNFYDGVRFHRVIKDFMIQGGDPLSKDIGRRNSWGTGGPGYYFKDEINKHRLVKGSLAMANSGPNTNGSQFFIVTADVTPWLDGRHTNFGRVIHGMDILLSIGNVAVDSNDRPVQDVLINDVIVSETK